MNYRNLGRTGLKVSELRMGAMNFGWTTPEENAEPTPCLPATGVQANR